MKILVDKLPKTCKDCVFSKNQSLGGYGLDSYSCILKGKCPLKELDKENNND